MRIEEAKKVLHEAASRLRVGGDYDLSLQVIEIIAFLDSINEEKTHSFFPNWMHYE